MNADEFRRCGHQMVDWIAEYLTGVKDQPVRRDVTPGSIRAQLPPHPPEQPESMADAFEDFKKILMPGVVHWNHPSFFAYFPANNSFPSILGELLSSGLGANGMNWATSPSVTELEELVMDWMRQACGLPEHFRGVIQDTASTSTLVALLSAREKVTARQANIQGLGPLGRKLRVYASREAHSSVEKAAKIAGYGRENFVPIPVDQYYAMDPGALERAIAEDVADGLVPAAVVASVGTTSSTSVDPVRVIGEICRRHGLWLHVDAAMAGSSALLPEKRFHFDGLELADSYVFNAHKWLFTNFDCSLYFVADVEDLVTTFEIMPEYLKTAQDQVVTNYRDWGIALGRRFRALKLWFVLRTFGLEEIRRRLRDHLAWAAELAGWIDQEPGFERMAPTHFQTVCFRRHPSGLDGLEDLNRLNDRLAAAINADGRVYLTPTKLAGRTTLRVSVGQTNTTRDDVVRCWDIIRQTAVSLR
jgi:aromatic-L-amino-acid decarboxylase